MMYDCSCTKCDWANDECPVVVRRCPVCGAKTLVTRNGKPVK